MRIGFRTLAVLAVLAAAAGGLYAWSGLFNVAASSGHWAITTWFLHGVMRQSVKLRADGIEVPPLDDPALIHRGAGHFASGCAPCHGAPGQEQSPIVEQMTPTPPELTGVIEDWEPNHLFWIVQHGVKYSGMPAWPALGRTDEIWAVTAFLLQLPGMDAETYRRLALGEERGHALADATGGARLDALGDPLEAELAECARCHGRDGAGRGVAAFPNLFGQSEAYLLATLKAFADGSRQSGIMQPAAAAVDEAGLAALARHYAEARPAQPREAPAPGGQALRLGETLARQGAPSAGVPACDSCHASEMTERFPLYPSLDGQPVWYLRTQLELWQAEARGGTPFGHVMATIASRMSPEQVEATAAYYAAR